MHWINAAYISCLKAHAFICRAGLETRASATQQSCVFAVFWTIQRQFLLILNCSWSIKKPTSYTWFTTSDNWEIQLCMFLCPHKLAPICTYMIDNPQEGRLSRKRKKLKICESIASSSLDASQAKIVYNSVCNSPNPHINRTRDIYFLRRSKQKHSPWLST
ncbi:unnamed protein product [Caenorhabditis sp. 36 PRJEB53466]|nr:unnamed protein product [Caenorhabditis sp. 36 PRJEB53466]